MINIKQKLFSNLELLFWITVLVLLFFLNENKPGPSLCFFHWLGISWCPGCGIGHAIHAAMHFQFVQSFQYHMFGLPGLLIIIYRIKELSFKFKQQQTWQIKN